MKTVTSTVTEMLEHIGEDPSRDGLLETPKRVVKAWEEMFSGYKEDPKEILAKSFENTGNYDEMIILDDIEFYSMCEHHILPFFGKVTIGYIPKQGGRVVGISKLARVVECFAKRLQIQEKMTQDIATVLLEELDAQGVGVFVEAQHLCMKMRGVKNHSSVMKTSSLLGCFKENPETRSEFLNIIK